MRDGTRPYTASVARTAAVIAAVLVLTAAGPSVSGAMHGDSNRGIIEGDTLPSRTLDTVDGHSLDLPQPEVMTVVVFWATWSPRCQPALAMWQEYAEEYGDHPLKVITVNSENQRMEAADLEKIDAYIEEHQVNLPVVLDRNLDLFNEIGVMVMPTTLFFDGQGQLVYKMASFPTSARIDLKDELEIRLGLRERETEEEKEHRGKLDYQPKNNALLYYNMAVNLDKKGFPSKAKDRLVVALQRDPEYADPLQALEGYFFRDGRTPEQVEALRQLLIAGGLEDLATRYE